MEVKQSVGTLILTVLLRKRHLLQELEYSLTVAIVARVRLGKVAILLHIIIYISHGSRVKRLAHNATDTPHSSNVRRTDAVGMHTQLLRMPVTNLVHHALQVEYLTIRASTIVVGKHHILVLTKIARKDRHSIILVDNTRLGRHESLCKQKLRAEPMHITYKHISHIIIRNVLRNAFNHAACSTIGKCKTQHILIRHNLQVVGITYAFGQYLGLATPRRCKYKMKSTLGLNHLLLTRVGSKSANSLRIF